MCIDEVFFVRRSGWPSHSARERAEGPCNSRWHEDVESRLTGPGLYIDGAEVTCLYCCEVLNRM